MFYYPKDTLSVTAVGEDMNKGGGVADRSTGSAAGGPGRFGRRTQGCRRIAATDWEQHAQA